MKPRTRTRTRTAKPIDYSELSGEGLVFLKADSNDSDNEQDHSQDHIKGNTYSNSNASKTHLHVKRLLGVPLESHATTQKIKIITNGSELTADSLRADPDSLSRPIIIHDNCKSIGMVMPRDLSVRKVADTLGHGYPVTVMDVKTQEEAEEIRNLGDLVEYFEASEFDRTKLPILNQISLEFSNTALGQKARSPAFVRELDWIDNVWPVERRKAGDYPRVQYYCLTSAAECFTDFHCDFGGTSVWYHVIQGTKDFLLVPPTKSNLQKYEEWLCSPDQNKIFFGDLCGEDCIRVTLLAGMTLIIPTAWIHAVYTPIDSVVFGGNFLHSLDIEGQLSINSIETRTHVQSKFRFPQFYHMMFYSGAHLLETLRAEQGVGEKFGSIISRYTKLCAREREGLPLLVKTLKAWNAMPGGDANIQGSKEEAAIDAAKRAGCNSVADMIAELESRLKGGTVQNVDEVEEDIMLIEGDGTLEKGPGVMKLKLRISNNMSGNTATPDRHKNKLKINLGAFNETVEFQKDDFLETSEAKDVSGMESDFVDDSPFQIFVPQNVSFTSDNGKKKSIFYNKAADAGDDEWVPSSSRNKRKTAATVRNNGNALSKKSSSSQILKVEKKVKQIRKVPLAAKKAVSRLSKVKPKSNVRSRLKKKLR